MEFTGGDEKAFLFDFIDEPVFIGYTAGPIPRQFMLEGLRFSNAAKRIPGDVPDKASDLSEDLFILD